MRVKLPPIDKERIKLHGFHNWTEDEISHYLRNKIEEPKIVVQSGKRGQPTFSITLRSSSLIGVRRVVVNPKAYKGIFKRGENIIDFHIGSLKGREVLALIELFREKFPVLREEGFAGVCCDTPNTAIFNALRRRIGMTEMKTPSNMAGRVKERYAYLVENSKFPEKYLKEPVKRLVLRF